MGKLKRLSSAFSRYSASKGFGIHSPFAYKFVTTVLDEQCMYYSYEDIDLMRSAVIEETKEKHGFKPRPIQLSEAALLFRITNFYNPASILQLGSSYGVAVASSMLVSHKSRLVLYDNTVKDNETAMRILEKYENRTTQCDSAADAIQTYRESCDNDFGIFAVINNITNDEFQTVNEFLNHAAIYDANGVAIIRNIATSATMAQLWDSCPAAMEHGMTFSNEKIAIIVFDHKLPRQDFKLWL